MGNKPLVPEPVFFHTDSLNLVLLPLSISSVAPTLKTWGLDDGKWGMAGVFPEEETKMIPEVSNIRFDC